FGIGSTTWKTGAGVIICALLAFPKAVKAGTQSHSWRNCCLTCWILLHRHRWFIARAHRLGPRTSAARSDVNGRTLIAKFMRSGDRDRILRASQEVGEIRWEGKRVVSFPDFSRGTITKRDAFRECKKDASSTRGEVCSTVPSHAQNRHERGTAPLHEPEDSHGLHQERAALATRRS
ncbi:hypothetical protein AMELA_G00245130, partial [Ameiurus melas]